MTDHLYYHDATLREFDARVLEQKPTEHGPIVRLDRTAFYPTSGGQPHDTGTLNGVPVVDVWEDDNGDIWHLLDHAFPTTDVVHGNLDWPRRFGHMQQHTGQHLLSAALISLCGANTIGFHLGNVSSTIDLDIDTFSWEDVARVEQEINQVIHENRPITVRIVSQSDLHTIPLRKPPQVESDVRIVWVEGYDASACGGTHVHHTGQVGMVKITGLERYKGGMRVTFLCGLRALADYDRALAILRTASQTLSVGQDELPDAVARLQDEVKDTHRSLKHAEKDLMAFEAERLWAETPETHGLRRIVAHWDGRSADNIRTVAQHLRDKPHTLLFLACTEDGSVRLVCARSDDLAHIDAAGLLRTAAIELGGRGGGSPTMAQGGAASHPAKKILEVLRQTIDGVPDFQSPGE